MKRIFLFLIVILILFGGYQNSLKPHSRQNYNDLKLFKYEVARLEFKDGLIHYITSLKKYTINLSVRKLKIMLEKINREIRDIKTFTHNHLEWNRFSESDLRFLSDLRWFGFRGEFLLYYKGSITRRR